MKDMNVSRKVALLFPGTGTQYVGMGRSLCETYPIAAATFEEAADIIGFDLQKLCWEGPQAMLDDVIYSQLAILTYSVACYRVLTSVLGVNPAFGCGHSVGEYAALTCAGVFDLKSAIKLVQVRTRLLKEIGAATGSCMAAVKNIDLPVFRQLVADCSAAGHVVYHTINNHFRQQVVAGSRESVARFLQIAGEVGADTNYLFTDYASHCRIMDAGAEDMSVALNECAVHSFDWPVIATVSARPYEAGDMVKRTLLKQFIKTVRWKESMEYLVSCGVDLMIEVGPQMVLKNLLRSVSPGIKSYAMDAEEDLEELKRRYSRRGMTTAALIDRCLAIAASTKNSVIDNNADLLFDPWSQLTTMRGSYTDTPLTTDAKDNALRLLHDILTAKGFSASECKREMEFLNSQPAF
ncbi:ACP S-malonyltransferase [Chitinophaga rhizophila]|uniref:[acyl-carrier-protein] S-malonyltransferase n=1 Tax=Chitinophaga rhizophila TaxID=2866212 RepID=A0ABS7GHM2_9BACT|nr:ACP S-malonyltransferase [Chitinophaga rhizophila]MBW8687203.1 ACP S-malonyltransferase [Chitinophaga rhizophila]